MALNKIVSLKQHVYVVIISLTSLFLIDSCKEEPLDVGIHLLPDDELLELSDTTLSVDLHTISSGPLVTRSLDYNSLGSVLDPVMGSIKTDYMASIMHNGSFSFKDTIIEGEIEVLDLQLKLSYNHLYADSLALDFDVYELVEDIPINGKSDYEVPPQKINPDPLNLGPPEYLNDSSRVIKVMLSNDYANKFLDPQLVEEGAFVFDSLGDGYWLFKENFKGLYIATEFRDTEGGGIIRVSNFESSMILRTLEWNSDSSVYDTVSNEFVIGNSDYVWDSSEVVNLGMYHSEFHDDIITILDDTVTSQPLAYLQSLTGPNVMVNIPDIEDFRAGISGDIVIHKAELKLPVNTEFYDNEYYISPGNLGIVNSISKTFITDDIPIPNYFGGVLDTTLMVYIFNVGNDLHEYMYDESANEKKYLLFPSQATSPVGFILTVPGRVVIDGRNTANEPDLKILYSVIKE